jgi:capsular exopolysaccharide synthesis family protein
VCPDLCRQKSGYENLDVIAAGAIPPNPAELISGSRAKKIFELLKKDYDYILIDTPPSLVVTDAMLYKDVVNGYLIVIRANKTRSDSTARLLERFRQVGAHVIGFILNDRQIRHQGKYKSYTDYSQG